MQHLPSTSAFDIHFKGLAEETLRSMDAPPARSCGAERIPDILKKKVTQLLETGVIFPDSDPACFRPVIKPTSHPLAP